mmetsp:Transcript_12374/g.22467  ORF Transcript_12374/g.22467 Transcript_12374/m.22467 type:complete len:86 (+) Transcript_12374:718-975(+)
MVAYLLWCHFIKKEIMAARVSMFCSAHVQTKFASSCWNTLQLIYYEASGPLCKLRHSRRRSTDFFTIHIILAILQSVRNYEYEKI